MKNVVHKVMMLKIMKMKTMKMEMMLKQLYENNVENNKIAMAIVMLRRMEMTIAGSSSFLPVTVQLQ